MRGHEGPDPKDSRLHGRASPLPHGVFNPGVGTAPGTGGQPQGLLFRSRFKDFVAECRDFILKAENLSSFERYFLTGDSSMPPTRAELVIYWKSFLGADSQTCLESSPG